MPATAIKPDSTAIDRYYERLEGASQQDALHEGNVRNAFEQLLEETARVKNWTLVSELGERAAASPRPEGEGPGVRAKGVRYDGVLRDSWKLPHGYWEAKDTHDSLEVEIRKKRDRGYSFANIIFEDTRRGILFQDGNEVMRADLHHRAQLAELLTRFYSHEIQPFLKFGEAVAYFQHEIPTIARGLKERIDDARQRNRAFQQAFGDFLELCRTALNPNISTAAVDEMLIQHMLTERLIVRVFDMERFARQNVIAAEIDRVIEALASRHFNYHEFLGALDRFYDAIERAADELADFGEKQAFLNGLSFSSSCVLI